MDQPVLPQPRPLDLDVSFNLTLDTEIGRINYKQISEDGYDNGEPYTLLDAIVDRMARMGVQQLIKDADSWRSRRDNVHKVIGELLREKLEPMIDSTIDSIVRPTDNFGEPTGEATTFRKVLVEEMKRMMNPKNGNYAPTPFDKAMHAAAESVIVKELQGEINKAKETIRAAAQEAAAAAISKAVMK